MKMFFIFLLTLIVTGCSNENTNAFIQENNTEAIVELNENFELVEIENFNLNNITNGIYYKDNFIEFPCKLDSFEKNKLYVSEKDKEIIVKANSRKYYIGINNEKNENLGYLIFYNDSNKNKKLEDCYIIGISQTDIKEKNEENLFIFSGTLYIGKEIDIDSINIINNRYIRVFKEKNLDILKLSLDKNIDYEIYINKENFITGICLYYTNEKIK